MKNKNSNNNNITILQQVIPKYRLNFFKELNSKLKFDLCVSASGLRKPGSVITKDKYLKINLIKNFNFINIAIFQFLPFKKLFLKKIIIFEFNLRIISSILLLLLRIFFNKKNILWTHGLTDTMSSLSKTVRVFLMKRANSIIVYETPAKKILIKYGIPKKNIFIAKNSIDIRDNIKFINLKQKRYRVTFIGRIIKEKNVMLLCNAFSSIIKKIDNSIVLTIIGNGKEHNVLKKKFNNNRIKFIGYLDDEKKISNYLNQTLFTVSPDYLGLSIIHSFSYKVPILVNKFPKKAHSPEIALLKNNYNGWYFNRSQKSLENQILKCLNNRKKLEEFGKNGYKKVKKEYGIEIMTENFLEAIRNCRDDKNK